jgi:LysM repeat protein
VLKDSTHSQDVLASQETMKIHTVRSGEHLSTIAKRYGCTVADLKAWNNIKTNTVKPGKKLTVYIYAKKPAAAANPSIAKNTDAAAASSEQGGEKKYKYYTVKKGDSLFKIAQNHRTTVAELKRLNNIGAKYSLMPGKKLKVGVL